MESTMQSCKGVVSYSELSSTRYPSVTFTDITSWIFTKDLEHPFVILDGFPPLTKYLHHVIQCGCWKDDVAGEDSAALRV
jgi:hypothetical protein